MAFAHDLEGTHTNWSCAHSHAVVTTCLTGCACECHGQNGYAEGLRRRGIHVHDWRVRIYLLQDYPDKLSIRCRVCSMSIPRDAKPNVIQP